MSDSGAGRGRDSILRESVLQLIAGCRTSEATCPDRGCREADLHVQFLAEPASSGVKKPMFVSQASNYVECRKIATPGIDLQRAILVAYRVRRNNSPEYRC